MKHKPYPTYKPSGVAWLGDVPEHWEVKKLKYISSIRYGIGEPPQYVDDGVPLIRATNVNAGTIEIQNLVKVDPNDIPQSRIVWLKAGEIIVVRSGAYTGDSSIIPEKYAGAIAGFDMVLSCTSSFSKFIAYGLLSKYLKDGQIYLQKLRAAQPHLNAEELGECLIILPPLPEQQAIATFLDCETGRIDRLMEKKKKLVVLLKEKRTALISHTVTKGLDASAKLKPSGVAWLGDIPEHWEVKRIRYILNRLQDGTHFSPESDFTSEYLYITAKNIKEWGFDLSEITYVSKEAHKEIYKRCPVKKGDVLYIKDGATAGIATVNSLDEEFSMLSSVAMLRPKYLKLNSRYLAYHLNMRAFKNFVLNSLVGGAMTRFTIEIISRFRLINPPLPEQQAIAAFLDRETSRIDALVSKVETVIERLKEYRTALISAAVTGKIDVREEV